MSSRRPVSSPGRVDKYPLPLMWFLRSKTTGGSLSRSRSRSRSRGRSRPSPLFVRRNKSAAAVTQEPSSPKVTCMGQVRVKRTKKIQPESRDNPTRRRYEWIRNSSFCNSFTGKIKTIGELFSFPCTWPKSNSEKEKDFQRSQLDLIATELAGEIAVENEEEGENFRIPKLVVSPTSTPPINALLLTRSRSAPYRSSSLAFRFWEENNQREAESQKDIEQNVESEATGKMNGVNDSAEYIRANIDIDGVGITELGLLRLPVLTRSKSEPARIGEKTVLLPGEEEG